MSGIIFHCLKRQAPQGRSSFQFPPVFFPHSSIPCSRMSTTPSARVLYEHIDDVERLEYYRPGGYHPIEIGNHLHGRYRVVHKLGYGTFSTTWLAHDKTLSKYVAVKVGTADSDQKEVDILSHLSSSTLKDGDPSKKSILPVLNRFSVHGSNGTHPCFVTAPARCSLADTKEASGSRLFQLPVARSLAAQLAMAVAYTHKRGLVHGGESLFRLCTVSNLTCCFLRPSFGQHTSSATVHPRSAFR